MRKIKIGHVGLGKLGSIHARNIALRIPNAELHAICDYAPEAIQKAKEELNVPLGFTNFEEMLDQADLDGVTIVSPSAFHLEHLKACIERNLPIFCEKPLGVNLEEVYEVEKSIQEKHYEKPLMLGFMRRFDPSYAEAKAQIDAGLIGTPYMVRCYGLDPIKWVKTAVPFAKHSGGIFLDMAIHDIDLARWLMGSEVKSVYASGGCFIEEGFAEFDDIDNGTAMARFENGGTALFFTSRTCHHGYHIETEVFGTEGSIKIGGDPAKNRITSYSSKGATKAFKDYFMDRFDEAYLNEMQAFIDAIQNGTPSTVGVIDGIKSTEIAYACKESFQKDEVIRL